MKIKTYITLKIHRLAKGYVFTYHDFMAEVNGKEAIIKALNRMAAKGSIIKISKGKYFKPEQTLFGPLPPNFREITKDLLIDGSKIKGYLTGLGVYNTLGLSTQVSNTIQIGCLSPKGLLRRGIYKIAFVKQKNAITKGNIPLLQILDAIKYIKRIPDTSTAFCCERFLAIIEDLDSQNRETLVYLSKKYPPATRALLGAFLDQLQDNALANVLMGTLNPISKYNLNGASKVLSNTIKWNIV